MDITATSTCATMSERLLFEGAKWPQGTRASGCLHARAGKATQREACQDNRAESNAQHTRVRAPTEPAAVTWAGEGASGRDLCSAAASFHTSPHDPTHAHRSVAHLSHHSINNGTEMANDYNCDCVSERTRPVQRSRVIPHLTP